MNSSEEYAETLPFLPCRYSTSLFVSPSIANEHFRDEHFLSEQMVRNRRTFVVYGPANYSNCIWISIELHKWNYVTFHFMYTQSPDLFPSSALNLIWSEIEAILPLSFCLLSKNILSQIDVLFLLLFSFRLDQLFFSANSWLLEEAPVPVSIDVEVGNVYVQ